jgi:hypothetical protein
MDAVKVVYFHARCNKQGPWWLKSMGNQRLPFHDQRAQWYQCSCAVWLSRIYWERPRTLAVWQLEHVQFVSFVKFIPMWKDVAEKAQNTVRYGEQRPEKDAPKRPLGELLASDFAKRERAGTLKREKRA